VVRHGAAASRSCVRDNSKTEGGCGGQDRGRAAGRKRAELLGLLRSPCGHRPARRRRCASYLDVFAYGMPPHGGLRHRLERWTARLTGAANVRQTELFPRDLHRLARAEAANTSVAASRPGQRPAPNRALDVLRRNS
jgi:hypothetical protein